MNSASEALPLGAEIITTGAPAVERSPASTHASGTVCAIHYIAAILPWYMNGILDSCSCVSPRRIFESKVVGLSVRRSLGLSLNVYEALVVAVSVYRLAVCLYV